MAKEAVGIGANLASLYVKNKLEKQKKALVAQREGELNRWFNKEYNKNILDSDYGKAMQTQIENRTKDVNQQMASTGAITGASDESKIATKAAIEKNVGNTFNNIASTGQARKDSIRQETMNRQAGYDEKNIGFLDAQQQSIDNAMENFTKAGDSFDTANSQGAFNTGDRSPSKWFNKSNTKVNTSFKNSDTVQPIITEQTA